MLQSSSLLLMRQASEVYSLLFPASWKNRRFLFPRDANPAVLQSLNITIGMRESLGFDTN